MSSRRHGAPHLVEALMALYALHLTWSLLSNSPLPPGPQAPFEYVKVQGLLTKAASLVDLRLFHFIAAALAAASNPSLGLKLASTAMLVACLVGAYVLAWTFSEDYLVSYLASIAAPLSPFIYGSLMLGDYEALTCAALASFATALTVKLLRRPSRRVAFAAALTTLALFVAEPRLAPAVALALLIAACCVHASARRPRALWLACLMVVVLALSTWLVKELPAPLSYVEPSVVLRSPVLLIVTIAAVALGLRILHRRLRKAELTTSFSWIVGPCIYAALFDPRALVLAVPVLLSVAAYPAKLLHESFTVTSRREKEEEVYEVEVDLEKLAPALLPMLLAGLLIVHGSLAIPATYRHNWVYPEQYEDLVRIAAWITSHASSTRILAHPSIAGWLAALSKGNILTARGEGGVALDSATRASFRVQTPYMVIDEWEPFSASRAPSIKVFKEGEWRALLFIDDSKVRALLIDEGGEWIESPYKAYFLGYEWIEEGAALSFKESYLTPGLIIEKKVTAYLEEPRLDVSYRAWTRRNLTLLQLTLPVFIEPAVDVEAATLSGGTAHLRLGGVDVTVTFHGDVEAKFVEEPQQAYVAASFTSNGSYVEASLSIEASTERSSSPVQRSSLMDLLSEYEAEYFIAPRALARYLEGVKLEGSLSLYLVDAYVRFSFVDGGEWIEAPAYAKVVRDEELYEANTYTRVVEYETGGLKIVKEVFEDAEGIVVTYSVEPRKPGLRLSSANLTLWVPWSRELLSYEVAGRSVRLRLDSCSMNLTFSSSGSVVDLKVAPPSLNQGFIEARFALEPRGGYVAVEVEADKALMLSYEASTRPFMESCDTLLLHTGPCLLRPAYSTTLYTVFKVVSSK